jgi:hypothetical protein
LDRPAYFSYDDDRQAEDVGKLRDERPENRLPDGVKQTKDGPLGDPNQDPDNVGLG